MSNKKYFGCFILGITSNWQLLVFVKRHKAERGSYQKMI